MFLNELDFIRPEDIPELTAASGGAAAGAAAAKPLGIGRVTGALGGVGAGLSAKDAYDRYKNKDYMGAAISAAGGVAGLVPHPIIGIGGPTLAAAINMCRDEPEACKDMLAGRKQNRPQLFEPRQPVTASELVQKKKERQLKTKSNTDNNSLKLPEDREIFQASPDLIKSIKDVESGNNPAAVSPKGALGTMQVMPPTAKKPGYGVQPAKDLSPAELERVGKDYFNAMLNKYGGDKRKALIAYNMGPGAADRWLSQGGEVSNLPKETQTYVPKVLSKYRQQTSPAGTGAVSLQSPDRSGQINQKQTTNIKPDRKSSSIRGVYTANPNWTEPPGPEFFKSNKITKPSTRPSSIEQIIQNRRRMEKADLDNLLKLFRQNPEYFKSIDPQLTNLVQSLGDLEYRDVSESVDLKESISNVVNLIYNKLLLTHGDLVSLYGHEIVGDAIEQVALQHGEDPDLDLNDLSKKVLNILKQRFETTEESAHDSSNSKVQDKNAMIQLQADVDKIKNTLDIQEGKIYLNVLATSAEDCKYKFRLEKDKKGWYLPESATTRIKLDALRTFSKL